MNLIYINGLWPMSTYIGALHVCAHEKVKVCVFTILCSSVIITS